MRGRATAALIVATAASCDPSECRPCGDVLNFYAHVPNTPEMLAGDSLTFCFNSDCVAGVLPTPSANPDGVFLTGAFDAVADVSPEGSGARVLVGPTSGVQF